MSDYPPMNPKVKKLWLKWLRSGRYRQTRGCLIQSTPRGDRFCCLGVLQNIAVDQGAYDDYNDPDWGGGDEGGTDLVTAEWARLGVRAQEKLMELNDGCGGTKRPQSFKQIAKWVEANL